MLRALKFTFNWLGGIRAMLLLHSHVRFDTHSVETRARVQARLQLKQSLVH